ncbi:MAG: thiol peroxidase [Desulfobacterales bacterium]
MATVTFKGNPVRTVGDLPAVESSAPDFTLTRSDLSETTLADYLGKTVVLNIFPSIDTPVCSMSVRQFNARVASKDNTVVLCASMDLPFAQARFCGAEGLNDVVPVSAFRHPEFGRDYGVTLVSGPFAGLFARAVVVIDGNGKVVHTQLVPEIAEEPDYESAMKAADR